MAIMSQPVSVSYRPTAPASPPPLYGAGYTAHSHLASARGPSMFSSGLAYPRVGSPGIVRQASSSMPGAVGYAPDMGAHSQMIRRLNSAGSIASVGSSIFPTSARVAERPAVSLYMAPVAATMSSHLAVSQPASMVMAPNLAAPAIMRAPSTPAIFVADSTPHVAAEEFRLPGSGAGSMHLAAGMVAASPSADTAPVPSSVAPCALGGLASDGASETELAALRRAAEAQEERIGQLLVALQAAQEGEAEAREAEAAARAGEAAAREAEAAAVAEAEDLRRHMAAAIEDMQKERGSRKTTPTAAGRRPGSLAQAAPAAQAQAQLRVVSPAAQAKLRAARRSAPGGAAPRGEEADADTTTDGEAAMEARRSSGVVASASLRTLSRGSASARARDEVDARLEDFCRSGAQGTVVFRKVNRGWYMASRSDEQGPRALDRTVELSLINGKLLARLEQTSHEKGWNNGKHGPIERFCAYFSQLEL